VAESVFTQIAHDMMNVTVGEYYTLHPLLRDYLMEIENLCRNTNSALHSRQAVALAIVTWQQIHPSLPPVIRKKNGRNV
jgi:hypothetical protein